MDNRLAKLDHPPATAGGVIGPTDERGFALAITIFALVLLAAIVAGGYFSATQEYQIGRSMRSLTSSYYAGEAGIRQVVADWDPLLFDGMAVGDTVTFGPTQVAGGGNYSAMVMRVGEASDSIKRYFYIEVVGQPRGPHLGARRQAVVVRAIYPDICCRFAATTVLGSIGFGGGGSPIISGFDQNPPVWPASTCSGIPTEDVAGARVDSSTTISDSSKIEGAPTAIITDSLSVAGMLTFNGLTYDDLVAMADHEFAGNYTMYDSNPTLDASGACDGSNPTNWGEPDDPGHPCFDYFPIIHVTDTLFLEGSGSAQGILLVEDGIKFNGPYEFYGIAISRGVMEMGGPTDFWGGAIVTGNMRFNGATPRFWVSQCAVARAQRLSKLGRPRLVAPRSWVELF